MHQEVELLLSLDPRGREEWLVEHEPEADRVNWWLAVLWLPKLNATYPSDLPVDRVLAWAELAVAVLGVMRDRGVIDEPEHAAELAWLSAGVAGRAGHPPAWLSPDAVAERCVNAIGRSITDVASAADRWRQLPVEDIRELRRVKQLVLPLRSLVSLITDRRLRDVVDRWVTLSDRLP